MSELTQVIVLSAAAGSAIPIGALVARFERLRPRWLEEEFRHTVLAFGGGVLLAAVALVLVPEGKAVLSVWSAALALLIGGVVFMGLDLVIHRRAGGASQLLATLADFLPEAVALGATAAQGGASAAALLALLIALQNLPEGFNAYRERRQAGVVPARVLMVFAAIALLGPAAGVGGYLLLADCEVVVGWIMLGASGGILYLTFQDIAPQTHLKRHWGPPMGAVFGFLAGMVGHMLVHGG